MNESYILEQFEKISAVSEHHLPTEKGELIIRSECEDYIFYDEAGMPEAVINTISYLKADKGSKRPVMFVWNGGPGSATSVLQLECFGPYLIERDTCGNLIYGLHEDGGSILDICDLVYVDPVGVGFSRLLNPEKRAKYYGLDGDAGSNAFAVVEWIRRHVRWDSPVYFCGESYGTVRVCRILDELARNPIYGNRMMLGLPVRGIILIGLALSIDNRNGIYDKKLDLLTAALPTMAAVNWYHNLRNEYSLEAFADEAWRFAGQELLPALFAGERCSMETIKSVAGQLAHYTGMDAGYFIQHRLSLKSVSDFCTHVVKGKRVNIYDGTKAAPSDTSYNEMGNENAPLKVMNGLLSDILNLKTSRLYYTGNLNVNDGWSFEPEEKEAGGKSHIQCLKDAMERMPDMRVLTASGLFDLCTFVGNTRYILSHNGLPSHRITEKEYAGGHGVYSSPEGREQFIMDVRSFILDS